MRRFRAILLWSSFLGLRHAWQRPGTVSSEVAHTPPSLPSPCRLNRGLKVTFQNFQGPDESGLFSVEAHPNHLDVDLSAVRLGGVSWSEVHRLAEDVESDRPQAHLSVVQATFHKEVPGRRPIRVLRDKQSLHTAYAALLTDRLLQVRYQQAAAIDEAAALGLADDDKLHEQLREVYCPKWRCAADAVRPDRLIPRNCGLPSGSTKRQIALIDPEILRCRRQRLKPHWPKVWEFASSMSSGSEFPPVRIGWNHESQAWSFADGCHRFVSALLGGCKLRVSFKPCSE